MLRRILMLPWRFFVWLTTDTGRRRPGRGEAYGTFGNAMASTHLGGHDREEELRRRTDEVKQHQRAAVEGRDE
jgi:hypothetical protein